MEAVDEERQQSGEQEVDKKTRRPQISLDKKTADFVTGLKERQQLRKDLQERTSELNKMKGQNYDLMKKVDSLEKQV